MALLQRPLELTVGIPSLGVQSDSLVAGWDVRTTGDSVRAARWQQVIRTGVKDLAVPSQGPTCDDPGDKVITQEYDAGMVDSGMVARAASQGVDVDHCNRSVIYSRTMPEMDFLNVIHGNVDANVKKEQYQASLQK
eukprot:gene11701-11846_t